MVQRFYDDSFTSPVKINTGVVYDVSDEVSFVNVRNWMKLIRERAPTDVNILLIGNKCDVDPSKRVS